MSTPEPHLSWDNFEKMIARGIPAIHRVVGDPLVDVFVDENARRIGVRIPCPESDVPQSPVAAIELDAVWLDGVRYLQVSTDERSLYEEFYAFSVNLADRLQREHVEVIEALLTTLSNWRALLQPVPKLSSERQLGLAGEVWLLARLVESVGSEGLRCWTGPLGEPHDFRLPGAEIEVKVTLSPARSHIINGEHQLMPSPGHQLWLLSLQLEPAGGAGLSLPELIDQLRERLHGGVVASEDLNQALERVGYSQEDRRLYPDRWQFRTNPRLVRVDANFPRITRGSLDELGPIVSQRVSDVRYRIDIEGLGFPDASDEYQEILPIGLGGIGFGD
ncbi:MAG: PD-(D/E)XK motif protein [Candidatus Dormiibacterota bacterium]